MEKKASVPTNEIKAESKPQTAVLVQPTTPVATNPVITTLDAVAVPAPRPVVEIPKTPMATMMAQVRRDTGLMFSGLAVLSKDTAEHISLQGYSGGTMDEFRTIFSGVLESDRLYFEAYQSEVFKPLVSIGLPGGFALSADGRKYNVVALNPAQGNEGKLAAEWLRRLGWSFYKNFVPLFEPSFLAMKADNRPVPSTNDRIVKLAERYVSSKGLEEQTWWFPFVLYMSALRVHIDLVK